MSEQAETAPSKWRDLRPRILSAVVMIAVGLGAIAAGHAAFVALVLVVGVIGLWELLGMRRAKAGALGRPDRVALAGYVLLFVAGILGLIGLSVESGRAGVLFVVGLVVICDTMGYFVGRLVGGPKFWPRVSPKKTWAGILGGWGGVAVYAALFHPYLGAQAGALAPFVALSVLAAFASQMGDIAESALKRRMGVKDSSNIIPGHGGVLDRFDALIGVAALYYVLHLVL